MTTWGGMANEGRVLRWCPSLSACGVPLMFVSAPRLVCLVALLNGGGGVRGDAPCSDWGWHLRVVLLPSCRSRFSFVLRVVA